MQISDEQTRISIPKFSKKIRVSTEEYYVSCPEIVAAHVAKRLSKFKTGADLCCMVGATAIQLAKIMERVYGVDIKKSRIEKARHNAKLYGVEKKTKFIVGSVLDEKILKNIKAEVAVLDPGWRLPDALPYSFVPSIRDTQPNLKKLFDLTKKNITPNIVLRIPPNFTQSMIKCFGVCRIENIITEGKVRFKIAYFLEDTKVCEVSEVHFPDFKYPERIKNYIKEKLCKR